MSNRIRELLQRVADQDTGKPAKVVILPPKLDELHRDIWKIINSRVDAQAERARIETEFEAIERDFAERVAAADKRLLALTDELTGKQRAMIAALGDCGIKAEIVSQSDGG